MTTMNNQEPQTYSYRAYLFFWAGQLQSILGSNIVQFVIIVWIAWEYNSSLLLGLSAFAGFAPLIVLTPFAGVLVDRWSRKKVIFVVDSLQALATAVLVYLFFIELESFWLLVSLFIILACRGTFQAFHYPATEAIIPLMVPREKLSRLNGLTYLMLGVITIIGPLIAVFLLLYWEVYEILLLDPITFLISVIPLLIIRIPEVERRPREKGMVQEFVDDFADGITFIKQRNGLLALLSLFTAVNFFATFLHTLLPLYVKNVHSGEQTDLGLIFATFNVGLLAGGLLMSSWKGFKRNIVGVAFGMLIMYVGFLIVTFTPQGSNAFLVMGVGMVIMGFVLPVINVSSQTIWQKVTPPEKIGRVFAARRSIAQITAPLAMITSGILAEFISIQALFFACIALGLCCLSYTWLMTELPAVEGLPVAEEVPMPVA
ncbi:MAG: MFS transporter [Candidatus Hodarchaeales archaeon]